MMDVIHSHPVSIIRLGCRPWLVSPNVEMLQGLSLRRCQKCGDVRPEGNGEVKRETEKQGRI